MNGLGGTGPRNGNKLAVVRIGTDDGIDLLHLVVAVTDNGSSGRTESACANSLHLICV